MAGKQRNMVKKERKPVVEMPNFGRPKENFLVTKSAVHRVPSRAVKSVAEGLF